MTNGCKRNHNRQGRQAKDRESADAKCRSLLEAVKQRGLFVGITRYQYLQYDVEEALKIVEAIGKSPGIQSS